ncbi:hypothetical protein PoB_005170500 [Plakobranchus ocellatus]|uniref:PDZ domain-containing protein n=1 Tax=Plakobranchus ocellatus TaxID=259542 RepID=A0AAV4C1C7_9GAST|nr:hypothetical protein PoB_005170500 [Plakobranchus ocellatus]
MEYPPSPSNPQSPSKSHPLPPAEKPQGPPPSPSPPYPFTPEVQGGSSVGEAALLIRNGTRFSEIDLKTGLHAAAATISLEKTNRLLYTCLPIPEFRNFLWLSSLSSFRSLFSCWGTSTRILLRGGTPTGMGGGGSSKSSQPKMI